MIIYTQSIVLTATDRRAALKYLVIKSERIRVFMKSTKLTKLCILLLAVTILCTVFLQACKTNPDGSESGSDSSTSAPTEPGSETSSETEQPAPVPDDGKLRIVENGEALFKIVRPDTATDDIVKSATVIYNALIAATGVKDIKYGTDFISWSEKYDPDSKEILIGITERDETKNVLADTPYGEYSIKKDGAKLVITAWDVISLQKACTEFADYINKQATENNFIMDASYTATGTGIASVKDLPKYATEKSPVKIVDLADNNYMLYLSKTNKDEFNTYLKNLEDSGFKQYAKREVEKNIFTTYTDDKYIINTTFTGIDNNARIIIEPKTYSFDVFEKKDYQKICEPSVTLVGLEQYGSDLNQIGLFLIYRLEDGRFVVVDGGGYNDKCINIISDNLKALAVDKNNITVAAWFFTHAHGDHTGGFIKFANSPLHSNVKVENFIFNFTTDDQYNAIDDGKDFGRRDQCKSTIATKYPKANVIKAHTGNVYRFADAEIEMLYTFDDIQPARLTYHNTTSLVFRYKSNDYTIICLGDAYTVTCNRVCSMYGKYLKSDITTISHHGYVGGTSQIYDNISATVNLWPGGLNAFSGSGNLREREYNRHALELASVKETYVAGKSVFTLPIPYKPDPNNQNTIIK